MPYLIYETEQDAIERNHAESTKRHWSTWMPKTMRDGPYWWAFVKHPSSGEVALRIPDEETDPELGILDADEIAALETELTADWAPEEAI